MMKKEYLPININKVYFILQENLHKTLCIDNLNYYHHLCYVILIYNSCVPNVKTSLLKKNSVITPIAVNPLLGLKVQVCFRWV